MRILDNNGYRDMTKEEIKEYNKMLEENAKTIKEQEIEAAKQYLQDTDYRIIKCYEAQLQGLEMPYSLEELIPTRQQARNIINQ